MFRALCKVILIALPTFILFLWIPAFPPEADLDQRSISRWLKLLAGAGMTNVVSAEQYFFSDEFNEERAINSLNPDKWTASPNAAAGVTTISETGGNLVTTQNNFTNQYPFIVSKNSVLPSGDFEAEIRFQYTHVTPFGTGIALSQNAPNIPTNDFGGLLALSIWQDNNIGLQMRLQYQSSVVYSITINTNPHIFKVTRTGSKYKLYLDGNLVYTSPDNPVQVRYIWFGNPTLQSGIPDWTKFNVDYVRVKGLPPEPFLELPWKYEEAGLTFNEAALNINSYFDHEYPLLSSGINEPSQFIDLLTNYEGKFGTNVKYSSHDGYDYGKVAGAKIGVPVLAAASGTATFLNSCGACGNAILIDHGNGYQTRYYHLQKDGLITNEPAQSVQVTAGEQIGKVGATGNVFPSGEAGAHIHFMVVNDKNGDGNFNDNIPDGITDPFGWQSESIDPWPNFFFNYSGKNLFGNLSFYLFKKQLDNLNATLTSNGGVFNSGRYTVKAPQEITSQDLNLQIKQSPIISITSSLVSVGSTIDMTARDNFGNLVTSFPQFFEILVDLKIMDLSRFKTSTLQFYSSPDGITWTPLPTEVDLTNKTAKTSVNHLTHFALIGERIDITAPITTAELEGIGGQADWFKSDVNLVLNAKDNEEGLGVDYTLFKINNGDWEVYENPVPLDEGNYHIEFYSVDNDENIEGLKTKDFDFKIDKTVPKASINSDTQYIWEPNGKMVDVKIDGYSSNKNSCRGSSRKYY